MNIHSRFRNHMYRSGSPVYCAHCAKPVEKKDATVDHIVPKGAGGKSWYSNFVIACAPCNEVRGRDFYQSLRKHRRSQRSDVVVFLKRSYHRENLRRQKAAIVAVF